MRTATPQRKARLTANDLSDQEGVFYAGCCPGGETPTLWEFHYKSATTKDGARFWFADCYQPFSMWPLLVPFSINEVGLYLHRV